MSANINLEFIASGGSIETSCDIIADTATPPEQLRAFLHMANIRRFSKMLAAAVDGGAEFTEAETLEEVRKLVEMKRQIKKDIEEAGG